MKQKPNSGVAVVTGSAGKTGSVVVEHLQKKGWQVAGIDLKECRADLSLQANVTDRSAMINAAGEVKAELGPVGLLVTAAAAYEDAPFGELELDRWRRLLAVHLGGTTNACAAFVPGMKSGGDGCVVTISQDLSRVGGFQVYNATAAGTIRAFSKSFACEMAPAGVRVNCISPRQPSDPAAIADTIVFLFEAGSFYAGQVISVSPERSSSSREET